jgi:CDP-glycerol glycerophosphotransferase (TagB/SpsB family)
MRKVVKISKGLAKWFLFSPLYILSFFIKRKPNVWCFGGFGDRYTDNSKIMFEFSSSNSELECIWITRSKDIKRQVESLGLKCELRYSLRGIYYSLIASKYFYACYLSDINFWTSGRVLGINLWHGTAIKYIENDIRVGPLSKVFNPQNSLDWLFSWICYPSMKRGHDVALYSSEYEKQVATLAFKAKALVNSMSPRNIKLLETSERDSYVNKNRVLFAPSWRSEGVKNNNEFNVHLVKRLQSYCQLNNLDLDVSIHPSSSLKIPDNIKFRDVSGVPIEERISHYCFLVTDFSSLFFDFLLLKKNVYFITNDFESYTQSDRGFYPSAHGILSNVMHDSLDSVDVDLDNETSFKNNQLEKFIEFQEETINDLEKLFNILRDIRV